MIERYFNRRRYKQKKRLAVFALLVGLALHADAGYLYVWSAPGGEKGAVKTFATQADADAWFRQDTTVVLVQWGYNYFYVARGRAFAGGYLYSSHAYTANHLGNVIINDIANKIYWREGGIIFTDGPAIYFYGSIFEPYLSSPTINSGAASAGGLIGLGTAGGAVETVTVSDGNGGSVTVTPSSVINTPAGTNPDFETTPPVWTDNQPAYYADLSTVLRGVGSAIESLPHTDYSGYLSDLASTTRRIEEKSPVVNVTPQITVEPAVTVQAPDVVVNLPPPEFTVDVNVPPVNVDNSDVVAAINAFRADVMEDDPAYDAPVFGGGATLPDADVDGDIAISDAWRSAATTAFDSWSAWNPISLIGAMPSVGKNTSLIDYSISLPWGGECKIKFDSTAVWIPKFRAVCLLGVTLYSLFKAFNIIKGAFI